MPKWLSRLNSFLIGAILSQGYTMLEGSIGTPNKDTFLVLLLQTLVLAIRRLFVTRHVLSTPAHATVDEVVIDT